MHAILSAMYLSMFCRLNVIIICNLYMLHKMFHALADVWRGFIYSTAEYQTTVAVVIFSANGVRQILQNHLHYAMSMRHNTCYFVALVLSHWPILASGFIQVIPTVVYTAVFSAVDRVVDADE